MAAAAALAGLISDTELCADYIIPRAFDPRVGPAVAKAVAEAARRTGADYAVDVYPHYGSDVEATLSAGHDLRHGLIGAGVYASHGYERSHVDGVWNTLKVLAGYLEADGVR